MNDNLNLFIRIVDHLVWLTTYDEYGSSRTKGLATKADLAAELNDIGMTPKRGSWTPHSLECFLSRMNKQYGKQTLRKQCDLRFTNSENWEVLSATHRSELLYPPRMKKNWDCGKITICENSKPGSFRTVENDLWKPHEQIEMWLDEKTKKKLHKQNILRRKRAFVT